MDDLRKRIFETLSSQRIAATPQAVNALLEATKRSNPEIVGDTDSLLVGLLYSGSYTVDILIDAGADVHRLRELAAASASIRFSPDDQRSVDFLRAGGKRIPLRSIGSQREHNPYYDPMIDPIKSLFSPTSALSLLLKQKEGSDRHIETADILLASMRLAGDNYIGQRPNLKKSIQGEIESGVLNVIEAVLGPGFLQNRHP
jgi:hypothetical protein